MFFSDANNFEKYSFFGNRVNKLRYNEYKNNDAKFELIPFLKDLEYDVDWHDHVLSTLSDRASKLVNPNIGKRSCQTRDQFLKLQNTEDFVIPKTPVALPKQPAEFIPQNSKLSEFGKKINSINECSQVKEPAVPDRDVSVQRKASKPETKQSPELVAQESFKNTAEKRTYFLMKRWYPLKFKLPYPRKSLLNAYEQREFIEFYNRFKNRPKISQSEVRLYKKYLHYKSQVEKERVEFFDYLQEYYKVASEDYEFINHSIEQYVNEMIEFKNQCANKFERFYQKLFNLSLDQLDENSHHKCSFKLDKNLLNIGQLNKIVVPSITIDLQPSLIKDYKLMSEKIPMSKKTKILSKIPLSEDENVEKLALKYNCGIAMTNSAFVHLIYHLTFVNSEELKLVIIIKEIETEDGRKQKILLLEKPFIEKYLSKRDINEKFYKKSLLVTLVKSQAGPMRHKVTKPSPSPNPKPKSSPAKEPERVLEKLNVDYNVVSHFESFGVGSQATGTLVDKSDEPIHNTQVVIEPDKVKKRNRQSNDSVMNSIVSKKIKSNNSSDYEDYGDESDTESLMIAEVNGENAQKIIKEDKKKTIEKNVDQDSTELDKPPSSPGREVPPLDFVPKVIPLDKTTEPEKQPKILKPKSEDKTESTEDKLSLFDLISKLQDKLVEQPIKNNQPHPTHHHVPKSTQNPAENPQEYQYLENVHGNLNYSVWNLDSMRILVRSSTVGYINTEHSSMKPVVVHAKIEYQPQFGCEKLSTRDYCKMWAKSLLRNYCDIYLCRINVFTNKLISVSDIKFDDLLPPDLPFNTNQSLNHFRNLLLKFKDKDNGTYLLSKDPNRKYFDILKTTKGHMAGSFDLHFYYNGFYGQEFKKQSYWMSIDTSIFLPYHFKLNRVPGLFDPQYKEDIKQRQPLPAKSKKKRRKGKQNKPNEQKNVNN